MERKSVKHPIRRNCGEISFDNPSDSLEIKNIYSTSLDLFYKFNSLQIKQKRKKERIYHLPISVFLEILEKRKKRTDFPSKNPSSHYAGLIEVKAWREWLHAS